MKVYTSTSVDTHREILPVTQGEQPGQTALPSTAAPISHHEMSRLLCLLVSAALLELSNRGQENKKTRTSTSNHEWTDPGHEQNLFPL